MVLVLELRPIRSVDGQLAIIVSAAGLKVFTNNIYAGEDLAFIMEIKCKMFADDADQDPNILINRFLAKIKPLLD